MKKIIIILVCLLGPVFLFFSYKIFDGNMNLQKSALKDYGVLVEYTEKRGDDGYMYTPVIEYTYEGVTDTFSSKLSISNKPYRIGEKVEILIPEEGGQPVVNSFLSLWLGFIVLVTFGVILSLVLVSKAVFYFKNKNKIESE